MVKINFWEVYMLCQKRKAWFNQTISLKWTKVKYCQVWKCMQFFCSQSCQPVSVPSQNRAFTLRKTHMHSTCFWDFQTKLFSKRYKCWSDWTQVFANFQWWKVSPFLLFLSFKWSILQWFSDPCSEPLPTFDRQIQYPVQSQCSRRCTGNFTAVYLLLSTSSLPTVSYIHGKIPAHT